MINQQWFSKIFALETHREQLHYGYAAIICEKYRMNVGIMRYAAKYVFAKYGVDQTIISIPVLYVLLQFNNTYLS